MWVGSSPDVVFAGYSWAAGMSRFACTEPPAAASRAFLYQAIRDFFRHRQVLEVETPVLSVAGNTDPAIESFRTADNPPKWLRTSPEFFHKRLLVEQGFDLFEIGKVFRRGESGARHNPEFSLLEWYRLGFVMQDLMHEVAELLAEVFLAFDKKLVDPLFVTYADVFQQQTGISPLDASQESLRQACADHGYNGPPLERDACLDLLFSLAVQPRLAHGRVVFVSHYPATQAALAQIDPDNEKQALRFECFIDGLELANGYQELTDATEQAHRFTADARTRQRQGLPAVPADKRFIAALEAGLPPCSGVALGLDRLLMLVTGARHIQDVLWFPWEKA